MAKLIFLLDGNVIQEYPLDKERMAIGRRASNDIHIDNLAISGQHAVIVMTGEETYIEDLNSTNGTLVNQKPIKKQLLQHGDDIGLGKYSLKYINDGQVSPSVAGGFEDTVTVQPKESESNPEPQVKADVEEGTPEQQPEQSTPDVEPEQVIDEADAIPVEAAEVDEAVESGQTETEEPALRPRLQILSGDNAGNALLLDKSMVKIGQPGEQIAVVTKRQEGYFVTHVAGESYPIINGTAIGAQAYALKDYDVIEVLETKMEFRLE